jgi:hypothetical protein
MMKALSVEESIFEGKEEVKKLFQFVNDHAVESTAYEMEQTIFVGVMRIGLSAMKCYFAQTGTGDLGETISLPDGEVLQRVNELRGRDYFSVFGKFKVPRSYYHCKGESGVFPLDAQADLPERCYSYLLQEWMDLLSLRDTFKESESSLAKLLGLDLKSSRFEVVNHDSVTSTSYDRFYEHKEVPSSESEGGIQVLQFDGKGVPVIKKEAAKLKARPGKGEKRQKKKEAMVGVSYTVDTHERSAEEVAQNLIYPEWTQAEREVAKQAGQPVSSSPKGQNIRRLASLERSKTEIVQVIVQDAKARDPQRKRPWVIVMDGALGLWAVIAAVLEGFEYVGILDIIHVVEYLWKAGNALYGEGTAETKRWVYNHLLSLLRGHVGRVIGGLKQTLNKRTLKSGQRKALKDAIRYFDNHRQWMHYDEYLKAGYPIGSGVVESTCAHTVKDRMEGTGRRWSIEGAESTLLLRSVYTSGDWDAYWDAHMKQERTRLYGRTLDVLAIADEYYAEQQTEKVVGI